MRGSGSFHLASYYTGKVAYVSARSEVFGLNAGPGLQESGWGALAIPPFQLVPGGSFPHRVLGCL